MIREVTQDDWQLLRDVRLRALADAPFAFLTTLEEASAWPALEWQERARPADDRVTFVAEGDGRFDGMVGAFVDEGVVFLVSLWVDPGRRGVGLAAQLVERVVDWARSRRSPRVYLAVEPDNDRAARLYERCGFVRPLAAVPFPWGDTDAVAYERRL
jgi:GNAT superfamily N-acetyltransferase